MVMIGYIDTAIINQTVTRTIDANASQTSGQLHHALSQTLRRFGISFIFAANTEYGEFDTENGIVWGLTDYDGMISVATASGFIDYIRSNRVSVVENAIEVIKHELVHRVQATENRLPKLSYRPDCDSYWCDPVEVEAYAHQAIAELEHNGYSLDDIVANLQSHNLSELSHGSYAVEAYSELSLNGNHEVMSLLVKHMINGCRTRCNHDYLFV
jgi:hypothetical protein